jgi:hypothetical protein
MEDAVEIGQSPVRGFEKAKKSNGDSKSNNEQEFSKEERIRLAREAGMNQDDFQRIYEIQMHLEQSMEEKK